MSQLAGIGAICGTKFLSPEKAHQQAQDHVNNLLGDQSRLDGDSVQPVQNIEQRKNETFSKTVSLNPNNNPKDYVFENQKNQGVKAPGIPTEKDGYIPPKNWDGKKVRAPNGRGYGYPDKNDRIWIPTGDGPLAHGGPHWDVQDPRTGDHDNVMPGGLIRPGTKK